MTIDNKFLREHATNRRNDLNSEGDTRIKQEEFRSMLPGRLIIFLHVHKNSPSDHLALDASVVSPDEPVAACLKFNNKLQRSWVSGKGTHTRD